MIKAILQYELLGAGAASCVLSLDTDQGDEVGLDIYPLFGMGRGLFINPGVEGMADSHPPPHKASCAAYDYERQRHVWQGRIGAHCMLTVEVTRADALLGWVSVQYERGQFFVVEALQLGIDEIDLQVEPLSASAAGPPDVGDNWRQLVRAYAGDRRVEEVLALFARRAGRYAAGMTQGDAETFRDIGFFLAVQGYLAQALSVFDLVLREQPTNTDVILARGIVLQGMGRHTEAERVFRAALSLDADRGFAWELLGDALLSADGDAEAALAVYERAITLNPGDASAYHGKGNALARIGRVPEALAAFQRAVLLDPCEPRYLERLQALRAEYPLIGASPEYGPAWDLFTGNTRLFDAWLNEFLDDLIAQRRGHAPAGEEILTILLDALSAPQQQAAAEERLEEASALSQAFLESWSSRKTLPWHPVRALSYWWVESQFKRRQVKQRKLVLLPVLFGLALLVTIGLLCLIRRRIRWRHPNRHEKGGFASRWHNA
jgi:tetratricopeptide (TPR) repeat protein